MYTLYTFSRSSTAWRVRIALNLKKIKVDYKFVDLFSGEQKLEGYNKVNPNQGVPSLVLKDGTILIQSMAIIQYLNQLHPTPYNLFPGDPVKKAQIRGFCQVVNSGIHPYQNLRLLQKIQKQYKADRTLWCKDWVSRGLHTIDKLISNNKLTGKYTFGNEITAADIMFYPQITATKDRFKIDINPYPRVTEILNNLNQIDEFVKSSPKYQSDYKE